MLQLSRYHLADVGNHYIAVRMILCSARSSANILTSLLAEIVDTTSLMYSTNKSCPRTEGHQK